MQTEPCSTWHFSEMVLTTSRVATAKYSAPISVEGEDGSDYDWYQIG